MTIATAGDGLLFFGLAALCLAGCAAPVLWALWTTRGREWLWRAATVPTTGIAIAVLLARKPLLLVPIALVVGFAVLARRTFQPTAQKVVAGLIVCAGAPLYALTLFAVVIGVAALGCAPDAYECPL
jgi:hypothetical protein